MRWLIILLLLGSLICVGRVHAQTSLGDANATSSLIFPQPFLKEQGNLTKGDSDKADPTGNDGQIGLTGALEPSESSETTEPSDNRGTADSESSETTGSSDNRGTIDFNTADGSIKGNYLFHKEESPWGYGFELQGKAINGYASLFANQDISSDAGVHIFAIYSPWVDHWFLARAGYRHGEYKLVELESKAKVPIGIRNERLHGPSVFLHHNALLLGKKVLTGVAVGWAHQSNYRELPQVEVTIVNPTPSDSTMPITESTSTAREGDYETFGTVNGDIDLLWIPERSKQTVGLGAFWRHTFRFNDRMHRWGFGGGLFYLGDLTEKTDQPKAEPKENFFSKITGGITVQRMQDPETGKYDIRFGLVTSYNF